MPVWNPPKEEVFTREGIQFHVGFIENDTKVRLIWLNVDADHWLPLLTSVKDKSLFKDNRTTWKSNIKRRVEQIITDHLNSQKLVKAKLMADIKTMEKVEKETLPIEAELRVIFKEIQNKK